MNKLLLIGALPPPVGGDAVWLKNFINHSLNQDLNIKIINTSFIGQRASQLGNNFYFLDEFRRTIKIWGLTFFNLILFKPEVVHLNCNCSKFGVIRDYFTAFIISIWGVPLVLHCHANVPDAIGKSYIGNLFLKRCLKIASSILVLNEISSKYCNYLSGKRCVTIPNFVNEDFIASDHLINSKITKVVFVGHMIRTKGLFEMVEVANRMPHISFLMAGMPNLENLNLEPPKNMKFLGNIDFTMLKGVLDSSDLFMFPTYSEGFSLALLEAMARGLPVVTTNVGANSDMIEKSGGLLVPTSDVEALCHALLQLENPELRSSMSIWNIAKVKNNYTAHQIIEKIRDLYESQREKSSKLNLLGSQE